MIVANTHRNLASIALGAALLSARTTAAEDVQPFLETYCFDCHDADSKKGGLDLTALKLDLTTPKNFAAWVAVHDRVNNGEMPPKKKARPDPAAAKDFTAALSASLVSTEEAQIARDGRSIQRRLNR